MLSIDADIRYRMTEIPDFFRNHPTGSDAATWDDDVDVRSTHPDRRSVANKKTAVREARQTGTANLPRWPTKETSTMHFSPPADLFGEQGLIVLIVVALVLFGSTQIPKLARSLGSAQKEFKKGLDDGGRRCRRGQDGGGRSRGADERDRPGSHRRHRRGDHPSTRRPGLRDVGKGAVVPFLSPAKLLVIVVIALVVLGPDKLPTVAKQIGGLWRDFRRFREKLESEVRGSFPDLPSTDTITRAVRSPLAFLDNLAETDGSGNEPASDVAAGAGSPDGHRERGGSGGTQPTGGHGAELRDAVAHTGAVDHRSGRHRPPGPLRWRSRR